MAGIGPRGTSAVRLEGSESRVRKDLITMVSLASRILTRFNTGDLRHAVKTGVAAVVCLYLADPFRLPQGYWAAVSATIVLQSSVGETVNASLSRFAGTAIGAVLGGVFVKL